MRVVLHVVMEADEVQQIKKALYYAGGTLPIYREYFGRAVDLLCQAKPVQEEEMGPCLF